MALIGQMIESKYLKQADVDGEVAVTVMKVGRQNIAKEGEEPEYKWLIKFNELPKPMVLNATNIKRLARACESDDTDNWAGKKVILYVDHDVEFAGNVVGGLRIRAVPKQTQTKSVPGTGGKLGNFEDLSSDVPF
jgi:hypothetical protein